MERELLHWLLIVVGAWLLIFALVVLILLGTRGRGRRDYNADNAGERDTG